MGNRWRAIPALALIAVIGLILAGLAAAVVSEERYREQRQQATAVQARILADSVTAALDFDDTQTANEFVNSLRADALIDVAAVYDAGGRRIAGFARNGAAMPVRLDRRPDALPAHVSQLVPVRLQDRHLGTVYVESALEPLARRLSGYWGIGLLVIMGSVVVIVLGVAQGELGRANAKLREEIAERARAEAALAQAQKMQALGQLTGGIAHDFNNLLTAVVGGLDLIMRRTDDDKVRRLAENSIKAAERGTKLTGQLLSFSRQQKLELRPVVVSPLISGMQELFRRTLGPQWELRFDLDTAGAPVLADRTQLELAVLNLVINARDAMPDGGRITISSALKSFTGDTELADGEYLQICVADTGTGIPPEVLARVFEPFFTTKGVGKGTGLGLSMVYGLAQQSGGTARIESEVGRGTTVCIYLPRASASASGEESAAPVHAAARIGRRGSVLVVDDDADVRAFLAGALEAAGHQVRQAQDGPGALAALDHHRPDVLVTDFAMPGMNGAELVQQVREKYRGLPTLVISGFADTEAIGRADADTRILRKPFRADELLAEIDRILASTTRPADTAAQEVG
jgi:signal transduction histidine kinase/CheY-like chemotaxis protein